MNPTDVLIEIARTNRELSERIAERMRAQQLGEAWDGIERRQEPRLLAA